MTASPYAEYVGLFEQFVTGVLDGRAFEAAFLELRRRDRAREDKIRSSWTTRRDLELKELLAQAAITEQEFNQRWQALWVWTDADTECERLLSRAFSATDMFCADADLAGAGQDLTEEQLRSEIAAVLRSLRSASGLSD